MTSTQARHTRRAVLKSAVDAANRCYGLDPNEFFRGDGESLITWQARRAEAIRICTSCPVRAACEELALRDGDGNSRVDDMVRGGLSGTELAAVGAAQAVRLATVRAADRDTEGRQLDDLTSEFYTEAVKNPDSSRNGKSRRAADRAAAQKERLATLADQIRQIRTARRARAGWGVAA
ncbi:WhiB family transcriptional regulator [Streptomyces sp. NPDC102437]|uniref:WhiB family transcriptional regulator n=1 Tax=Streptomyces sp. NPDC102437 TaxID=3366175 RepID=UPI003824D8A6